MLLIHIICLAHPARYHGFYDAWPSTHIPLVLASNIVIHLLLLFLLFRLLVVLHRDVLAVPTVASSLGFLLLVRVSGRFLSPTIGSSSSSSRRAARRR